MKAFIMENKKEEIESGAFKFGGKLGRISYWIIEAISHPIMFVGFIKDVILSDPEEERNKNETVIYAGEKAEDSTVGKRFRF
jgi:hypothetical protein